jgi:hypothetical protein
MQLEVQLPATSSTPLHHAKAVAASKLLDASPDPACTSLSSRPCRWCVCSRCQPRTSATVSPQRAQTYRVVHVHIHCPCAVQVDKHGQALAFGPPATAAADSTAASSSAGQPQQHHTSTSSSSGANYGTMTATQRSMAIWKRISPGN